MTKAEQNQRGKRRRASVRPTGAPAPDRVSGARANPPPPGGAPPPPPGNPAPLPAAGMAAHEPGLPAGKIHANRIGFSPEGQGQGSNGRPGAGPGARDRETLLADRARTHGDFRACAGLAQDLKRVMHNSPNWYHLDDDRSEALDQIATKIARALVGDPLHPDHWDDLAGYAALAAAEPGEG
jgi:hypothetical protein